MFKLESYITPIILSYVDKYVKNARAERSQVSLWGGDVVFSNLDLRLDVLERELGLPFTFVSGHIHELHINVPWTRLNAEPIVITINTIECVLRLPDSSTSSQDGNKVYVIYILERMHFVIEKKISSNGRILKYLCRCGDYRCVGKNIPPPLV